LVITGDLKLNLGNSFGYGETIKINWKRIQSESQRLSTKEEIPYLFSSFLGITHSLDILKQDSSYINFKNRFGINYKASSNQSFTAFWENEGTNSLSSEVLENTKLSSVSGTKNSSGLKFLLDWLDYKYNPRKGIFISLEGKAGFKRISGRKEGDLIILPVIESSEIYASLFLPETSSIIEGQIKLEGYLPIWKSVSIKLANNSGFKANRYLLDNDLFRLGGFSLLRGFDQQSVFSTNYSILTTEVRILFEENSFFNLFFDKSILHKSTLLKNEVLVATAIGAGINFQTRPGIFSISYALGKFGNIPFEFSSAKIHFGFINLF
jgi:outer membrane protein assembly factor BamA